MIKRLSAELQICWPSSRAWPSVIVQQNNTGIKPPAPLLLNVPLQFRQCFAVTISIHRLTSGQEVDDENAPSVPEYRTHHFRRRQSLYEFRLLGKSTVMPMHWLLLGFWGNVCNPPSPMIIRSRNSSMSSYYRCTNVNADSMRFALYSGISCFDTHLVHNFLNNRCSVTTVQQGAGNMLEVTAAFSNCDATILRRDPINTRYARAP